LERAGTVLLPFLLPALLAGSENPYAARGRHATEPFISEQPSLRGGSRPVLLRGALPDVLAAPCAFVAARPDAPRESYDALADHLASHGCATFVVERVEGEPWFRYGDAIAAAIWQVRAQAETPESPLHGRLDATHVLLIADGAGAAAAAHAAAKLPSLRGFALIDPGEPGPALARLAQVRAPFLAVAATASGPSLAEAWFDASHADEGQRWLVEFETTRLLSPGPQDERSVLQRDLRALLTAFADVELNLHDGVAPPFSELARRGSVDRVVRGGAAAIPLARADPPDDRR